MSKLKLRPWRVQVVAGSTVIHSIDCTSERSAERVDLGMQRNLDHERFATFIAKPVYRRQPS